MWRVGLPICMISNSMNIWISPAREISREKCRKSGCTYTLSTPQPHSTTIWNNTQVGFNTFIRDLMVVCPSTESIDNCLSKDGGPWREKRSHQWSLVRRVQLHGCTQNLLSYMCNDINGLNMQVMHNIQMQANYYYCLTWLLWYYSLYSLIRLYYYLLQRI